MMPRPLARCTELNLLGAAPADPPADGSRRGGTCSGGMDAVDYICEKAKPIYSARMAVKLAVAGAFHTDFMAPAAEALTAGLKDTPISTPKIPVISNVNVEAHTDADAIRATLAKQVSLFSCVYR